MSLAIQELRKCLQRPSTDHLRRRKSALLSPVPEEEPNSLSPLAEEEDPDSPTPPAEEETSSIYVCVFLPITNDTRKREPPLCSSVSVEDATILTKPLSKRHRAGVVDLDVAKKEMMRKKMVVEPQHEGMVLCYDFLIDVD